MLRSFYMCLVWTSSRTRQVWPRRCAPTAVLLVCLAAALPASAAIFRVDALSGSDGAGCGTVASPCASIQQAVDLASSGDTILVQEAVYVDDVDCVGSPAVVCVFQKELTILGGFAGGNWSLPDPATNVTVIDGQDVRRGVVVRRGGPDPGLPATSLRMEGFTVRNGRADGTPNGLGGGLQANFAGFLTLRDMVFQDNAAVAGAGGLAGGGGVAVQSNGDNVVDVVLERLAFHHNQATGGGGTGGVALGGGLLVDFARVEGLSLDFNGNSVTGGASSTAGKDGLGGGVALSFGTDATFRDLTVTNNTSSGGSATGSGGGSFGGGLFIEGAATPAAKATDVEIYDSVIADNSSTGGSGSSGGGGVGGAADVFGGRLTLERSTVLRNVATGGTGNSGKANAGGGGLFLEWPFSSAPPLNVVRNSVVADNVSEGSQGGGAGIRLLAARASVIHTTLVDNQLVGVGFGAGILVGPRGSEESDLTLGFSLLANHGGRALHVQATAQAGSSADLSNRNHFVGNTSDTNAGLPNSGTYVGYPGTNIFDAGTAAFFIDPTTSDYHVDGTQPPTNSATGSGETVDLDGAVRGGNRDLGADEFGARAFALTVGRSGVGNGIVVSSPAGIDCGADCYENYAEDAVIGLTPTAGAGSAFIGWSGDADCGDGSVTMTADRSCIARFEDDVPATLVVEKQTVPDGRSESFDFTGAVSGSIADGQQLVLGDLTAGTYTVTEDDHPLFDLTGISCDDGNSSGDLGSATATFRLEGGEMVTCVFTNTLSECSAADNDLVLSGETVNNTRTETACDSITAGPYTVGPNGDVTFETLRVMLRDGFSVEGSFRVVINTP